MWALAARLSLADETPIFMHIASGLAHAYRGRKRGARESFDRRAKCGCRHARARRSTEVSSVSVKRAESFERALGHCLKYALKHVPSNPERAAALEAAFNGVRRFQCAGAFFNVPESPTEKCHAERGCPYCESALQFSFCSCFPLPIAANWGFMNLGDARRAKALGMKPSAARDP